MPGPYAAQTTVTWVGLEVLRDWVRQLPAHLTEKAAWIIQAGGDRALTELRAAYPEGETGNLKRGLRLMMGKSPRYATALLLRSTAPHAYIFEAGTKVRWNRRGAKRGIMPAADIFVPIAIRQRSRMYGELRALVESAGFDVTDIQETSRAA